MALFLTESVETEEVTISLAEAYEGLLEASMDMGELSEALLQGDFVIHENAQNLTEAEQTLREENFLQKAGAKVKEFILRMRDKIVLFFKRVSMHAKTLWNKIIGKESNPSGKVIAPAGAAGLMGAALSQVESLKKVAHGAVSNLPGFKKDVAAETSKAKAAVNKLKALFSGKDTKTEEVDASSFSNVFKYGIALAAAAGGVATVLTKRAELAAAGDKVQIAASQAQARAVNTYAFLSGAITTQLGKVKAARAAKKA